MLQMSGDRQRGSRPRSAARRTACQDRWRRIRRRKRRLRAGKLRKRLDGKLSWEQKRPLIEILVLVRAFAWTRPRASGSNKLRSRSTTASANQTKLCRWCCTAIVQRGTGNPNPGPTADRRRSHSAQTPRSEAAPEGGRRRLGVEKTGIANWECNRTIPEIQYMPAIIRFLGYNPLTKATGWGPWLVRQRTALV